MRPAVNTGGRRCSVRYCESPSKKGSYSTLCTKHRHRYDTHGDAQQVPVFLRHLTVFRRELRWRLAQLPEEKQTALRAWQARRWETFTRSMRAITRGEGVHGGITFSRDAATALLRVLEHETPETGFEVLASIYLLQDRHARTFVSDDAFWFTLARLFQRLEPTGRVSYRFHNGRRWKVKHRPLLSRRVRNLCGHWLADFVLPFAHRMVELSKEGGYALTAESDGALLQEIFQTNWKRSPGIGSSAASACRSQAISMHCFTMLTTD